VGAAPAAAYDHVVFLHVQKAAGTSLCEMMTERLGGQSISHGDYLKYQPHELASFRFIAGHFGYDYLRAIPGRNFTFTFLREPVDRIVSLYYFLQNRNPQEFAIYALAQQMSFTEFVRSNHPVVSIHVDNAQVWQLARGWPDGRWRPTDEELLSQAIANLDSLSFFGFQETFESGVMELARRLDLEIASQELPRSNRSQRPDLTELPPEAIESIHRRTELDRRLYEGALALSRRKFTRSPLRRWLSLSSAARFFRTG
jgi:hypothetical protein